MVDQNSNDPSTFFSKQCSYCGGRLESKGVRYLRRRYRCVKCKKNAGSIALTELEIELLRSKDKKIGNLGLEERRQEIERLRCKKTPYCLLPEYDPKFTNKDEFKIYEALAYRKYNEEKQQTKKVTTKLGSVYND